MQPEEFLLDRDRVISGDTPPTARIDYILLPLIVGLALYVAFIPHLNYPYPVHIDEWAHLALSRAMQQAGNIAFPDPFYGRPVLGFASTFESGFDLLLAVFQRISGISWMTIARYFPGMVSMLIALSAYLLGRRQGFGWEAAFFAGLIPTTVGILGPALLVPVALGLFFMPLVLFVAFSFRNIWTYPVLFILVAALIAIHAATAVGAVLALIPYILLNLRKDFWRSAGMALAVGIPCALPFFWLFSSLVLRLKPALTEQAIFAYVDYPLLIRTFGYPSALLCLVGVFVLALKGGRKKYGLALGLFAFSLLLAIFYSFHRGIPIIYDRGLMWLMLLMSVVAGAGLMAAKNLKFKFGPALLRQHFGKGLCLVLVALVLFTVIPMRQKAPFYHMIYREDYEAFAWIRDNVGSDYRKAILDPWKATAFTAITGKQVYTRIHSFPRADDQTAYALLREGVLDTNFLRKNGISIVYLQQQSDNPDLVEVRRNVYLLKEPP